MNPIYVTEPLIPDLDSFVASVTDIFKRKWLTNNGHYHKLLEEQLATYLKVPYISLFANGTLALIAALKVSCSTGEVITTPYTFVATAHAIRWAGFQPVFVDIAPNSFLLDPCLVEDSITERTCAIMPVHVYGLPCDHAPLAALAEHYNLPLIYDASHAFGVTCNLQSIAQLGDMAAYSFHATKTYSTIEGGAVVSHSKETKVALDQFRNFGFVSDYEVIHTGFNAKMNELQAAYGIANLELINWAIMQRKSIAKQYLAYLHDVPGIRLISPPDDCELNYSYFPIVIEENTFGASRNHLFYSLKEQQIFARKYFFPSLTEYAAYANDTAAQRHHCPIAKSTAETVLCLPIHHNLTDSDVQRIVAVVKQQSR